MTDTATTYRVINMTEKRNVVTGLTLEFAHATLKRMRETYRDSRYTLGKDTPTTVAVTPTQKCPECHGHGHIFGTLRTLCLVCLGAGIVVVES